jgi:N-methylhydantoinase A
VRDFPLVTFGGSGSLLLCRLMDVLDLPCVLVPPNPGNVSAFGLLTVDVKNDYVQTAVTRHADLDVHRAESIFTDLRERAARALDREGFARAEHRYARSADLRYFGQAFEVRVPVPDAALNKAAADDVVVAFHAAHRALYGYDFACDTRQQVEWVNLRVSGVGPITRPALRELARSDGSAERARTGTRTVCFDGVTFADTAIYWRADLGPGDQLDGPAVVEEFGSTVPLHPGFGAQVDPFGNLIVSR